MLGKAIQNFGVLAGILCAQAYAGPTYFLVAEPGFASLHGDSYVLPLTKPDDVAHARDLILRGPEKAGASIVFAEIAAGSGGGINRDLLKPERPEWNWHITEFHGFGDVGIELIDSWPTYVSQNRGQWFAETGKKPNTGHIGFWSYTVVSELNSYPGTVPPVAVIPLPGALTGGSITIILIGAGYVVTRKYRWR